MLMNSTQNCVHSISCGPESLLSSVAGNTLGGDKPHGAPAEQTSVNPSLND